MKKLITIAIITIVAITSIFATQWTQTGEKDIFGDFTGDYTIDASAKLTKEEQVYLTGNFRINTSGRIIFDLADTYTARSAEYWRLNVKYGETGEVFTATLYRDGNTLTTPSCPSEIIEALMMGSYYHSTKVVVSCQSCGNLVTANFGVVDLDPTSITLVCKTILNSLSDVDVTVYLGYKIHTIEAGGAFFFGKYEYYNSTEITFKFSDTGAEIKGTVEDISGIAQAAVTEDGKYVINLF